MSIEKEKKPIFKKWWFWVIILVLVIALVAGTQGGNSTTDGNSINTPTSQTTPTQEKFSLVDSEGSYDGFAYYVTGTIKNNTDKEYSYAQVTFTLYDADGAQIGTAMANINNLEANGTWKFRALGGTQEAASYKLSEITGW